MKETLTLGDFIEYAHGRKKIFLSQADLRRVKKSRQVLEELAKTQNIYGVNTGVGPLFREVLETSGQEEFQKILIRSHAAGTGNLLSREESRGMMLLLINMLRKGYSGICLETLESLVDLFNQDIIPAIPEQGSLGASGDLAPLAHLALPLIGEGAVLMDGKAIPTKYSWEFETGKIKSIQLKPGEALALINGTHFMTSLLALSVHRAETLVKTADLVAGITIKALCGNSESLDLVLWDLRPHPGQKISARNIAASFFPSGARKNTRFLQDAYSLRCAPQVHGAVRDTVSFVRQIVAEEINSVTGNPIFLSAKNRVIHGGNFHGQPLSMAADFLGIALASLANVSERRIDRLLNSDYSGLPGFLAGGDDSGYRYMMAQYTAASLVAENKVLAHPSSVDSISVAGGQEDFVSMGAAAVRHARQICQNSEKVIAVELLCAMRAMDLLYLADREISEMRQAIKKHFAFLDSRMETAKAIEGVWELIHKGVLIETY